MKIRKWSVYKRYLFISGFIRYSDKEWSVELGAWFQYRKYWFLYFYTISLFGKKDIYKISFSRIKSFKVKSFPLIYTLEEIKKLYPNRWLIPASPEILIKYNKRLYKVTELKEFY
jgi:hypothetical protein